MSACQGSVRTVSLLLLRSIPVVVHRAGITQPIQCKYLSSITASTITKSISLNELSFTCHATYNSGASIRLNNHQREMFTNWSTLTYPKDQLCYSATFTVDVNHRINILESRSFFLMSCTYLKAKRMSADKLRAYLSMTIVLAEHSLSR